MEDTSDMAISTVGMHSAEEGRDFAPLSYTGREVKILHNGFVWICKIAFPLVSYREPKGRAFAMLPHVVFLLVH